MKTLAMFLLAIGFVGKSFAEETLILRVDAVRRDQPGYTAGLITGSGWEVWGICLPDYPDLEVGRLWPVYEKGDELLLVGGYAALWAKECKLFALPWMSYRNKLFRGKLAADLAVYAPLNGGPWVVYSNEISLTWPLRQALDLGPAVSLWDPEGTDRVLGIGLTAKVRLSKSSSASLRYLWGIKAQDALRAELTLSF